MQKTAVVAQRKAAAVRAIPAGTLEHTVLGEAVFGPAKRDYEKYAAAASNILTKRPAEELGVYGPGRATRRRCERGCLPAAFPTLLSPLPRPPLHCN